MKKLVGIMLSIILGMIIVAGLAVGGMWYLHRPHAKVKAKPKLTPAQALALQVTLPQMLTNLGDGGIVQFTLSLQASDSATKGEINQLQNQINDYLIHTFKNYTSAELDSAKDFNKIKAHIRTGINAMLPKGQITAVYFSDEIVQAGG